jgi:UDP-N-acetyl-D-glucosamine dehydrogenase
VPGLGLRSSPLDPATYDCTVIVTDHSSFDYAHIVSESRLLVDLRNATGDLGSHAENVSKL